MYDSQLIRRHTLDRARIMFETDVIRDTLTSQTPRRNAIVPEMDVISILTYLATGQMQLYISDDLGLSQPSISKVITQTCIALSELFISFLTNQSQSSKDCVIPSNGVNPASSLRSKFLSFPRSELLLDWSKITLKLRLLRRNV